MQLCTDNHLYLGLGINWPSGLGPSVSGGSWLHLCPCVRFLFSASLPAPPLSLLIIRSSVNERDIWAPWEILSCQALDTRWDGEMGEWWKCWSAFWSSVMTRPSLRSHSFAALWSWPDLPSRHSGGSPSARFSIYCPNLSHYVRAVNCLRLMALKALKLNLVAKIPIVSIGIVRSPIVSDLKDYYNLNLISWPASKPDVGYVDDTKAAS